MPRHVGQRTVDEKEEEYHEEHVGREAHALSKGASDKRWRDDGKLHLKQGKQSQRNGGTTQHVASRRGIDFGTYILEHQERQGIANDATDIVTKTQRETDDYPKD